MSCLLLAAGLTVVSPPAAIGETTTRAMRSAAQRFLDSGDFTAAAGLLRDSVRIEWARLSARLPPDIAAALPPDLTREEVSNAFEEVGGEATDIPAGFRSRFPESWAALQGCPHLSRVVASVTQSGMGGRTILVVPGEPARGAWGNNHLHPERIEIRLTSRLTAMEPDAALSVLLFEVMNSRNWAADERLHAAAADGALGRKEYVLAGTRLEMLAGLDLVRAVADDLPALVDAVGLVYLRNWSLDLNEDFVTPFTDDPPLSVAGYPWSSHGKNYDVFLLRRAQEAGDIWTAAAAHRRILLAGVGAAERRRLDEFPAYYLKCHGPFTPLGAFLRLPDRAQDRAATTPGATEALRALDRAWAAGRYGRSADDRTDDLEALRRAVAAEDDWTAAAILARVRANDPGRPGGAGSLRPFADYLRARHGADTLLGRFVRLPAGLRRGLATRPFLTEVLRATDLWLSAPRRGVVP